MLVHPDSRRPTPAHLLTTVVYKALVLINHRRRLRGKKYSEDEKTLIEGKPTMAKKTKKTAKRKTSRKHSKSSAKRKRK
jgi:hypothetical protein